MQSDTVVVLSGLVVLLLAAGLIFFVRRLFFFPVWTAVRRAVFRQIADFLKTVSATLLGITLIGYILNEIEGQTFQFEVQGFKLLAGASMFLVTSLIISGLAADENAAA